MKVCDASLKGVKLWEGHIARFLKLLKFTPLLRGGVYGVGMVFRGQLNLFKTTAVTLTAGLMLSTTATSAHAQQREIINPSFEQVGAVPGLGNGFEITPQENVPGWFSTNGEIEIWVEGFQQRTAQEGGHLAELNPSAPVGLYQEICLINGEQLNWDFYHAARGAAGGADQTALYEVADSNGNQIQLLTTNTVTPLGATNNNQTNNLWDNVTGSTIYTGPSGIQRLQFRSTNAGSNGNFLDDINIVIIPLITFENLETSGFEGDSSNLPQFVISGVVPTAFDIDFVISGGTATLGTDYTVQSNSITIPAGTYDGSAASTFVLPITVPQDSIAEGDETIEITYTSVAPASSAVLGGPQCTDAVTVATHTIFDLPFVEAIAENFDPIESSAGGVTGSVLASDTINGVPVNPADVTLTVGASDPELTLDPATGFITVAPNTPPGTYTVEYTICEDGSSTNCSTVVETVIVQEANPSLVMEKVADSAGPFTVGDVITYTYTVTNNGDTVIQDVVVTDTHNGSDPAPVPSGETLLTDAAPTGDSTDAAVDGSWDALAPGDVVTFTGTYTVTATDADTL